MLRQSALLPLFLVLLALAPLLVSTHPFSLSYSRQRHSSSGTSQDPPLPQQNGPSQQLAFSAPNRQQHSFEAPVPSQEQDRKDSRHNSDDDDDDESFDASQVGQDRPDELLTLRHVLHHGATRYPKLFRQRDISKSEIRLNEVLRGESMTHRIKVKTTTTVQPKGEQFKSFRSRGFRAIGVSEDQSFGPGSYKRVLVNAPDMADQQTLVQLGKMNYNSYNVIDSSSWYDLEGNWNVNSTFGWEEDGLRGHVFASRDNSTLIIAIKGTTAAFLGGSGNTAARDKTNDNLLFSCCCAKIDLTWRAVCDCKRGGRRCDQKCVEDSLASDDTYYNVAMKVLWTVQDMYPNANIWLTGHSLGGGVASLLGLTFGVPTVTFEIPGDRLAAQRLHLPGPPAINWNEFPLYHVGHTADPIYMGVCNGRTSACYFSGFALESKCHTGRTCVYDTVGEDKWKVSILKHRLTDTIEGVLKVKTVPGCSVETDCVDCQHYEYL
ncbi:Alpha/Beta hydrolase protein [Mortierella sp. GBAus27b]|nr:Alpha/Beta hydrolase protein [Mortierella sp. GBAus27b]